MQGRPASGEVAGSLVAQASLSSLMCQLVLVSPDDPSSGSSSGAAQKADVDSSLETPLVEFGEAPVGPRARCFLVVWRLGKLLP